MKTININFKPANQKQHDFMKSTQRFVLLSGSVSCGKTFLGLWKGLMLNFLYPGNRGLICRKEGTSLHGSTLTTLFSKVLPKELIVHHDKQKGIITHKTGTPGKHSYIVYSGLDKKADQEYPTKIGSTEYGWVFFDECIEGDKGDIQMIFTRLRWRIPGMSEEYNNSMVRQFFGSTNPGSPLHFLHEFFIEEENITRKVFYFTPGDNPYNDPKYLESLESSLSGIQKERLWYGKWVQSEGIIYDMFDPSTHLISDRDLLPEMRFYKRVIAGADSNYPLPRSCLIIGVRGDGRFDVIDEYYRERSTIEELISWLVCFARNNKCRIEVFHDPSDPQSIKKINDSSWLSCDKAVNAVLPGISVVAGLLRDKRLFIHRCCVNLVKEINSYVWKKGKNDVPVKENDHLCDSLRYGLASVSGVKKNFSMGGFF